MNWTAKTILGLLFIFAVWIFGGFGLDVVLRVLTNHHREPPTPEWQLIGIFIVYAVAGPVSGAIWVRWARRKAAEEYEEGTRERIGALRVAVRPLKQSGPKAP